MQRNILSTNNNKQPSTPETKDLMPIGDRPVSTHSTFGEKPIFISDTACVVNQENNDGVIKYVNVNKLTDAHKKTNTSELPFAKVELSEGLETHFLRTLLKPKEWIPPADNTFQFKIE